MQTQVIEFLTIINNEQAIASLSDLQARMEKIAQIEIEIKPIDSKKVEAQVIKLNRTLQKPLAIKVDDERLTDLNKHLDVKDEHYEKVKGNIENNPIKVNTEYQKHNLSNFDNQSNAQSSFNNSSQSQKELKQILSTLLNESQISYKRLHESKQQSLKLSNIVKNTKQGFFKNIARGFQEGIGLNYAQSIGTSFMEGSKITDRLNLIGKTAGNIVYETGNKAGNILLESLLGKDVKEFFSNIKLGIEDIKININTEEIENLNKQIDSELITLTRNLFSVIKNGEKIPQNIKQVFKLLNNIKSEVKEGALKRKENTIKKVAQEVKQQPIPKYNYDNTKDKTVIVSGGFAGEKGDAAHIVLDVIQEMFGDTAEVQKIMTPFTDVEVSNKENMAVWTTNALARILDQSIGRGYNPDAIDMVLKTLSSKQANSDRPVELVGYSAGGYVVNEAMAILNELGITGVKGTAIGTPTDIGIVNPLPKEQYQSFLGNKDILHKFRKILNILQLTIKENQATTPQGDIVGHSFQVYGANPEVQTRLIGKTQYTEREQLDIVHTNPQQLIDTTQSNLQELMSPTSTPYIKKYAQDILTQNIPVSTKELESIYLKSQDTTIIDSLKPVLSFLYEVQDFIDDLNGSSKEASSGLNLIALEMAKISNLVELPMNTPSLVSNPDLKQGEGLYRRTNNTIHLPEETANKLKAHNFSEMTSKEFNAIIHEIRHFFQQFLPTEMLMNAKKLNKQHLNSNLKNNLQIKASQSVQSTVQPNTPAHIIQDKFDREIDAYFYADSLSDKIQQQMISFESQDNIPSLPVYQTKEPELIQNEYYPSLMNLSNLDKPQPLDLSAIEQTIHLLNSPAIPELQEQLEKLLTSTYNVEGLRKLARFLNIDWKNVDKKALQKTELVKKLVESSSLFELIDTVDLIDDTGKLADKKTGYNKANIPDDIFNNVVEPKIINDITGLKSEINDDKSLPNLIKQYKQIQELIKWIKGNNIKFNLTGEQNSKIQGQVSVLRDLLQEIQNEAKSFDFSTLDNVDLSGLTQSLDEQINKVVQFFQEQGIAVGDEFIYNLKKSLGINSPSKQTKMIGEFLIEGLLVGLENSNNLIEYASQNLGELILDTIDETLDINSPSEEAWKRALNFVQGLANGLRDNLNLIEEPARNLASSIAGIFDQETPNVNNFTTEFQNIVDNLIEQTPLLQSFANGLQNIVSFASNFLVFNVATGILKKIQDGAFDAALQVDNLQRALTFSTGKNGVVELQRINEEANQLGINFLQAAEGLRQFSANTIGTSLAEDSSTIVNQFQRAFASFGLNAENQEGAFVAISQIASKGVVSMEELRQQLAERLPGALSVASRSMGMTVAEFNKLVESGMVLSDEFLPKLAKQLELESAVNLTFSSKSVQSELNRLENNIFNLQAKIGKPLLDLAQIGLPVLNKSLQLIGNNIQELIILLISLSVTTAGYLAQTTLGIIKSIGLINVAKFAVAKLWIVVKPFMLLSGALLGINFIFQRLNSYINAGTKKIKEYTQSLQELSKFQFNQKNQSDEVKVSELKTTKSQIETQISVTTNKKDLDELNRQLKTVNGQINTLSATTKRYDRTAKELFFGRTKSSQERWDLFTDFITIRSTRMSRQFVLDSKVMNNALNTLEASMQSVYQTSKTIDIGKEITVEDNLSQDTINKVKSRLQELRNEQINLKLKIALSADSGDAKLLEQLNSDLSKVNKEIARVSTAPFADITFIEKQLEAVKTLQEQTQAKIVENDIKGLTSRANSYRIFYQELMQKEEDLTKQIDKKNEAIKITNELYSKQIQTLRKLQRELANIEYVTSLTSIDNQINAILRRANRETTDFEFDTEMRQAKVLEIETKLTLNTESFNNFEQDVSGNLNKLDATLKQQISNAIGVEDIGEAILEKQISPEALAQIANADNEKIKELIEQSPDLRSLIEKGQEYLNTWQGIQQLQLESVNLIKEGNDAFNQRRLDKRDFLRQIEDFDLQVREYFKNRTRQIEDFARQFNDASIQNQRATRDLIESYIDLNRGLNQNILTTRNQLLNATNQLDKLSFSNQVRSNFNLGSNGLLSRLLDDFNSIFESQFSFEEQTLSLEEERFNLQQEITDYSKQIRGLAEQSADLERERQQQLVDLTRQTNDFVTEQINSWRDITRSAEDMAETARQWGVSFDGILESLNGINSSYASIHNAIAAFAQQIANQIISVNPRTTGETVTGVSGTTNDGLIAGLMGGAKGKPGSGTSTGVHLHFAVKNNGQYQDPSEYLKYLHINDQPATSDMMTSGYGMRFHPIHKVNKMHNGIDLKGQEGDKLELRIAPEDIKEVRQIPNKGGYGHTTEVELWSGLTFLFGHLSGFGESLEDYSDRINQLSKGLSQPNVTQTYTRPSQLSAKATEGNWKANPNIPNPTTIYIGAGHQADYMTGTTGTNKNGIVAYEGLNRQFESALNLATQKIIVNYLQSRGYNVKPINPTKNEMTGSTDPQKQKEARTKYTNRIQALEKDKNTQVIELHYDRFDSLGKSGVIPPMDAKLNSPLDERLGTVYGKFGQQHANGLAMTNRGMTILELQGANKEITDAFNAYLKGNTDKFTEIALYHAQQIEKALQATNTRTQTNPKPQSQSQQTFNTQPITEQKQSSDLIHGTQIKKADFEKYFTLTERQQRITTKGFNPLQDGLDLFWNQEKNTVGNTLQGYDWNKIEFADGGTTGLAIIIRDLELLNVLLEKQFKTLEEASKYLSNQNVSNFSSTYDTELHIYSNKYDGGPSQTQHPEYQKILNNYLKYKEKFDQYFNFKIPLEFEANASAGDLQLIPKTLGLNADNSLNIPLNFATDKSVELAQAFDIKQVDDFATAIKWVAEQLGVSARDLASLASFESAHTFSTDIMGGTNNKYQGWMQFSPDNRKTYGVKQGMTQGEYAVSAYRYFKDRGIKQGDDIERLYHAINPGYGNVTPRLIKDKHFANADKALQKSNSVIPLNQTFNKVNNNGLSNSFSNLRPISYSNNSSVFVPNQASQSAEIGKAIAYSLEDTLNQRITSGDKREINEILNYLRKNQAIPQQALIEATNLNNLNNPEGALAIIQANVKDFEQIKSDYFKTRREQITQEKIEADFKSAQQFINSINESNEAVRNVESSMRNLSQSMRQVTIDAQGFVTYQQQIDTALLENTNRFRDLREQLRQTVKDLNAQLDVSTPEKLAESAKLFNDKRAELVTYRDALPEGDLKDSINRVIQTGDMAIQTQFGNTEIIMKFKAELDEQKLDEKINQIEKNTEILVNVNTQFDIEQSQLNTLSSFYQSIGESFKQFRGIKNATPFEIKAQQLSALAKYNELLRNNDIEIKKLADMKDVDTSAKIAELEKLRIELEKFKDIEQSEIEIRVTAENAISEMQNIGNAIRSIGDIKAELNPFFGGNEEQYLSQMLEIQAKYKSLDEELRKIEVSEQNIFDVEKIKQYRSQLAELEEKELRKLEIKMLKMGQLFYEPFKQAMRDTILEVAKGTKSINDILLDFANGILGKLADMVSNSIADSIFNWISPQNTVNPMNFILGGLATPQQQLDRYNLEFLPNTNNNNAIIFDSLTNSVNGFSDNLTNSAVTFSGTLADGSVSFSNAIAGSTNLLSNSLSSFVNGLFGGGGSSGGSLWGSLAMAAVSGAAGGFGGFGSSSASAFTGASNYSFASGIQIQGFSDGGEVKLMPVPIDNFAQGGKVKQIMELGYGMAKAMEKEGSNAVPVVAYEGEVFLSHKTGDAQLFDDLYSSGVWNELKSNNKPIANYNNGGFVGGNSIRNNTSNRTDNRNVNYNNQTTVINIKTQDAQSFVGNINYIKSREKLRG